MISRYGRPPSYYYVSFEPTLFLPFFNYQVNKKPSFRQLQKINNPEKYAEYLKKQQERSKERGDFLKSIVADKNPTKEMSTILAHDREMGRKRQQRHKEKKRSSAERRIPMTQLKVKMNFHKNMGRSTRQTGKRGNNKSLLVESIESQK